MGSRTMCPVDLPKRLATDVYQSANQPALPTRLMAVFRHSRKQPHSQVA